MELGAVYLCRWAFPGVERVKAEVEENIKRGRARAKSGDVNLDLYSTQEDVDCAVHIKNQCFVSGGGLIVLLDLKQG